MPLRGCVDRRATQAGFAAGRYPASRMVFVPCRKKCRRGSARKDRIANLQFQAGADREKLARFRARCVANRGGYLRERIDKVSGPAQRTEILAVALRESPEFLGKEMRWPH